MMQVVTVVLCLSLSIVRTCWAAPPPDACECHPVGSVNADACESTSGNCTCKVNFGGKICNLCADGYYGFPLCIDCGCDDNGAVYLPGLDYCDQLMGECLCKPAYRGRRCDECMEGYTGYPDCEPELRSGLFT